MQIHGQSGLYSESLIPTLRGEKGERTGGGRRGERKEENKREKEEARGRHREIETQTLCLQFSKLPTSFGFVLKPSLLCSPSCLRI